MAVASSARLKHRNSLGDQHGYCGDWRGQHRLSRGAARAQQAIKAQIMPVLALVPRSGGLALKAKA